MLFEDRKLEIDSADELLSCRISTVKPYVLMLAPVYVFMKRNEKFVAVKAPLDFFTPEELESFSVYSTFHLPKSVSTITPVQTSARVVRGIFSKLDAPFPPAQFEVARESMKILRKIWGLEERVDFFSMAIFTDELCGALPSSALLQGRDTAVVRHDLGLLLSGALIFLLAHLGWGDLSFLRSLREEVYRKCIEGGNFQEPRFEWEGMARDLMSLCSESRSLSRETLARIPSSWASQVQGRLTESEAYAGHLKAASGAGTGGYSL